MSWIKRNLVFVVLGAIAVVGLGASGWYLYSQWGANRESTAQLEQAYQDLANIAGNPGNDEENIKKAQDAQKQVRAEIAKTKKFFVPIERIPQGTNVSAADFNFAVRRTIDELRRAAATASVTIQPNYDFTFGVEKPQMKLSAGAPEPLAAQLGDIKAICEVLFAARVNNLYALRRTRVCEEDRNAQSATDYIETSPVTNDLAVLVPYEVTFYGFSGEVASVVAGFANQSHGFIITGINVEPGTPGSASSSDSLTPNPMNTETPMAMNPYTRPYGGNPYGNPYQPTAPTVAPTAARPGGPNIKLDERQLKVTMAISVVKLLPK